MIKKIIIINLVIICFCSSNKRIQRQLDYNNRMDITQNDDESLTIKSTICDITVQYIFDNKWEKLCKDLNLSKSNLFLSEMRKPPLHFFIVCLHNTSYNLITPESFYLSKKNKKYSALRLSDFKNNFRSPVYKNQNIENLFLKRRLTLTSNTFAYELSKIDYKTQSIRYDFNFILPDDKIIFIKAFEKTEITNDNFKLNILLKYKNIKKTIDFDIKFSEYRVNNNQIKDSE